MHKIIVFFLKISTFKMPLYEKYCESINGVFTTSQSQARRHLRVNTLPVYAGRVKIPSIFFAHFKHPYRCYSWSTYGDVGNKFFRKYLQNTNLRQTLYTSFNGLSIITMGQPSCRVKAIRKS